MGRAYDLLGRQICATDPDPGTAASTNNDLSQLTSVTSAAGKVISYTYDAAGRRTFECDTTGGAAESGSDELLTGTWISHWTSISARDLL